MKQTYDEVLVRLVGRFPLLLPSAHESPSRYDAGLDLGQVHLYHHTLLSSIPIAHFCDTVAGAAYLQEDLALHVRLRRGDLQLRVFHVFCGTTRKIRLVLLSLRVREVGTLIGVECQA